MLLGDILVEVENSIVFLFGYLAFFYISMEP